MSPNRILELFEEDDYLKFIEDFEEHKDMIDQIKYELANSPNSPT
jgi:hypothetical protein